MSDITIAVRPGVIRVARHAKVTVHARHEDILAFEFALGSKYAVVSGIGDFGDAPGIELGRNGDTMRTTEHAGDTIVSFPELTEWTVWTAVVSRYTLRVTMRREP